MPKVFVHGNPETDAIWSLLSEALAARGVDDLVLMSPPGFGALAPEAWVPTPENYVAWLAGELEGLDGEVDLVGHDWGALHVYGLVAEHPELVRSWAGDCAGALNGAYVWHALAQVWQQTGPGEEWVDKRLSLTVQERTDQWLRLGLPEPVAQSMAAAFNDEMGRCILGLYRTAVPPVLTRLADRLALVESTPALIIDPTEDLYVPSFLVPEVVKRLEVEHLRLPGQGHWWMLDEGGVDQGADGLVSFWTSLETLNTRT